jgi:hypothetical protein
MRTGLLPHAALPTLQLLLKGASQDAAMPASRFPGN